ncbi:MAG: sn-glycerol-1-phosphate dehydrogenase [Eubacterium sp.]
MGFKELSINALINHEFDCSCGKKHIASIENIAIGKKAVEKVPEFLATQKLKNGEILKKTDKVFVVADVNTWTIAGKHVFEMIENAGYPTASYVFPHKSMHAEDKYAEEMTANLPADTKIIIAVGSGSLNDLTRYVAFNAGMPYYIVATAPSMDGYASNVSPLVHNNLKITYPAECANAIIGDTDILATAPDVMIAAGLGDILGKYLAINDWKMSQLINDEYYCPEVGELVLYSVKKCVDTVPGLVERDSDALQYLMESLVLIGIAMSYIGFSRPASASEHHISHFLEMKSIFKGEYGELHGTCVGMATCMISDMYAKFLTLPMDYNKARQHAESFDYNTWEKEIKRTFGLGSEEVIKLYEQVHQNDPEIVGKRIDSIQNNEAKIIALINEVVADTQKAPTLLKALCGLTSPAEFNVTGEEFKDILMNAKELRNRYAALQFFYDMGVLEELADAVIDQYMA